MKKVWSLLTLACAAALLSACEVNGFDGKKYDVPWYVIALFLVAIFLITYITMLSNTYICKHCEKEFRPKWHQFSICMHFNGTRLARCPHCGKRSFCKIQR